MGCWTGWDSVCERLCKLSHPPAAAVGTDGSGLSRMVGTTML